MDTKIPEYIKDYKTTVGYLECDDKKSFEIGAIVAYSQAENYYHQIVKRQEQLIDQLRSAVDTHRNDLKTMSRIINRYSEE